MSRVTGCAACGSPVDTLLAPAPLILGGCVVMCCSEACRDELRAGSAAPPVRAEAPSVNPLLAQRLRPPPLSEPDVPVAASAAVEESPAPAATDRPRELAVGMRQRLRGWPAAALCAAVGVMLLSAAIYLILEHFQGEPVDRGGAVERDAAAKARDARPPTTTRGVPPSRRVAPGPDSASNRGQRTVLALKQRSWKLLETFLASEVVRFRLTAADVLAEQGHSAALQTLRRSLAVELWTTRRLAAESLARLGHEEGLSALRSGLRAKRKPIKWASAFALARCGDRSGVGLIKQLAYFRKHRMTSYEALVRLGDEAGKRYLRRVLRTARAPYDRLRAAVALGLTGDRSGLSLLQKRLQGQGMHLGVALALQKLGAPAAQQALRRALEHTALRVEAARALRSYGAVTDVGDMAQHLGSEGPESRLTAAAAIVILTTQSRAEAP